eukprot:1184354-Prorocentrum_minimum.AAC.2
MMVLFVIVRAEVSGGSAAVQVLHGANARHAGQPVPRGHLPGGGDGNQGGRAQPTLLRAGRGGASAGGGVCGALAQRGEVLRGGLPQQPAGHLIGGRSGQDRCLPPIGACGGAHAAAPGDGASLQEGACAQGAL